MATIAPVLHASVTSSTEPMKEFSMVDLLLELAHLEEEIAAAERRFNRDTVHQEERAEKIAKGQEIDTYRSLAQKLFALANVAGYAARAGTALGGENWVRISNMALAITKGLGALQQFHGNSLSGDRAEAQHASGIYGEWKRIAEQERQKAAREYDTATQQKIDQAIEKMSRLADAICSR